MRCCGKGLVLAAAMVVSGPARADRMPEPEPAVLVETTFWEWLADPAAHDVAVIVAKTASVVQLLEDPTGAEVGAQLLGDVYGMLRYGLRRSPDHPELLLAMGAVAEALGKPREALDAFERFLRTAPDQYRAADAWMRAGYLRAQLGDDDHAREAFQQAIMRPSPQPRVRDDALIGLAWLHLRGGHATRAIDLLSAAAAAPLAPYNPNPLPHLMLAIALDRDGQITRAHQVITDLTKSRPLIDMITEHNHTLATLRYLDPLDRHYVAAFVYEVAGMLEDALPEWQLYARAADTPYRARARTHARDIAALLQARFGAGGPR
ncbi:MAG TPA: tetratricopeptide repeat protein [Kofleriaceae bacterium]|nr:tetratricopeptide repeat protein [Kofleriaceae bacterium]